MGNSYTATVNTLAHQLSVFNNTEDLYKKIRVVITLSIILLTLAYWYVQQNKAIENTSQYISKPQIDDIYYLDFRLLSNKLRPKEKFRLAKVVDITGEVITLVYSDFFYVNQKSMNDSIRYGHLRYKKYFQGHRYNFTLQQLNTMQKSGAIFTVERPNNNKLHGNYIKSITNKSKDKGGMFIPGKQENISGESYLKAKNIQNHDAIAFEYFKESAQLNYAQGQINLAQMYLLTHLEQQDYNKALYWLKQAALQSNITAINKYAIVCSQVDSCNLNAFYQALLDYGVNIRFNQSNKPQFSLD